jgi:hypothetical protein
MNEDNQLKHHIFWIMKITGAPLPEKLTDLTITEELATEIDSLVAHVKANY